MQITNIKKCWRFRKKSKISDELRHETNERATQITRWLRDSTIIWMWAYLSPVARRRFPLDNQQLLLFAFLRLVSHKTQLRSLYLQYWYPAYQSSHQSLRSLLEQKTSYSKKNRKSKQIERVEANWWLWCLLCGRTSSRTGTGHFSNRNRIQRQLTQL